MPWALASTVILSSAKKFLRFENPTTKKFLRLKTCLKEVLVSRRIQAKVTHKKPQYCKLPACRHEKFLHVHYFHA